MENVIVEKIKKLLALATSPNEHEAKLATEKANELLIKHNIKMQDVTKQESDYTEFSLEQRGRVASETKWVLNILKDHFFVQPFYRRSKVFGQTHIILFGDETNVEVAKYIYDFLMTKFYDLWREYKFNHAADTMHKQSYYAGLYQGLDEQLKSRLAKVQTETGLVLRRDPKLDEYTKDWAKTKTKVDLHSEHAQNQGYQDGKKIQINKGITSEATDSGKYLEKIPK